MLLKRIFPDAERTCDFIVVAVLIDLFGDLEFAVCEVAGVFQVGEGLLEIVGLGLAVGDLVEDGVQVHADGLEVEHVFIGERAVFFGAEEGEDPQEFLLVDTGILHRVEDVVFAVAVDVEGGVEALLVFKEVAFPDEAGFAGVEEPEEVVFVCDTHVFVFGFGKGFRDADGGGEADGVRVFGGFVEEDAGVAVGDDHFQAEEEFCFDFVKAGAGIEIVDHVVDHQEGIFFHGLCSFELFEISILSYILEIKYIYLKSINLTPEIKHCIRD